MVRSSCLPKYDDMSEAENYLTGCADLDRVVVRPSWRLNSFRTVQCRTAVDSPPSGVGISRADVADIIRKRVCSDEHLRRRMTISYWTLEVTA